MFPLDTNASVPNETRPMCVSLEMSSFFHRYSNKGETSAAKLVRVVFDTQLKTLVPRSFLPWYSVLSGEAMTTEPHVSKGTEYLLTIVECLAAMLRTIDHRLATWAYAKGKWDMECG